MERIDHENLEARAVPVEQPDVAESRESLTAKEVALAAGVLALAVMMPACGGAEKKKDAPAGSSTTTAPVPPRAAGGPAPIHPPAAPMGGYAPSPTPNRHSAPVMAHGTKLPGIDTNVMDVIAAARNRLTLSRQNMNNSNRAIDKVRSNYIARLRQEAAGMLRQAQLDRQWAAHYERKAAQLEAEAQKVANTDYFPGDIRKAPVDYTALASDRLAEARAKYHSIYRSKEANKAQVIRDRDYLIRMILTQVRVLRNGASNLLVHAVALESEANKLERTASSLHFGLDNFNPGRITLPKPGAKTKPGFARPTRSTRNTAPKKRTSKSRRLGPTAPPVAR